MNYRQIKIEHVLETMPSVTYGDELGPIVRDKRHTVQFIATLSENGDRIVRKRFTAYFYDRDLDDHQVFADKIIKQFKETRDIDIFGGQIHLSAKDRELLGDEWTTTIEMHESTKELFSLLTKYSQRLLDVF